MAKVLTSVTLPGSLYQKNGRWWWKVRLPGETKTRARALKPEGSRYATTDRQEAEEVAREMWRLAIETEMEAKLGPQQQDKAEHSIAKVRAKAAEEIANVKKRLSPASMLWQGRRKRRKRRLKRGSEPRWRSRPRPRRWKNSTLRK